MMIRYLFLVLLFTFQASYGQQNKLIVYADSGKHTISKHIYGQFTEHLGRGIYEGIWVGEKSAIPNTKGIRNDVAGALRQIQVPNLRWPGGCFADEYHWMDGIGPREQRPRIVNTNWGGVTEDNSFGTHEFLNFCEMIGTEPYISANVGSGTVEEMAKWVEYMNADGESPMANLRRKNGRDKPWNVKFWGVGNESWGCGGNMRPEYYSDLYRQYATYCRDYGNNKLFKIASGATDYDYQWTETLLKNIPKNVNAISLHYYTVKGWTGSKGSALKFSEQVYLETLAKSLGVEEVLQKHITLMNKYDPENKIGLIVDEWGTWFDVEPGTKEGFLYQQNTMRDAFVAAMTLYIFHQYAYRIVMANLAQLVNVLQALILTRDAQMVLTPTYRVFELYKVHQEATFLPSVLTTENFIVGEKSIPTLNVSCSKAADGKIHVSLVNVHTSQNIHLPCGLAGRKIKNVTGKILTSPDVHDHNTFEEPGKVALREFTAYQWKGDLIQLDIPARSVVVLEVELEK